MALLLFLPTQYRFAPGYVWDQQISGRAGPNSKKKRYLVDHVYYDGRLIVFLFIAGQFTRRPRDYTNLDQQDIQYPQLPPVHSMDPVEKVKGMYRLLDLIGESGSNGYGEGYFLDARVTSLM